MHAGWPSPSLHQLLSENSTLPITNEQGSWLAIMPLIGAAIGSLITAATVDILGRKKTILLTSFPFFAAWIMVAYARSVVVLVVGRLLAGAADGATFTAVPIYLGEIAEPKIRGMLGSSCSATFIFGIFLINAMGSYLSITVTALLSSLVPIALLLTFMWMPESPYYLLIRGNIAAAKKSLQIFRGIKEVDIELNRIDTAVKEQMQNTGKFVDLFKVSSNRKALFIVLGLRAAQQFSGTMAITFYAKSIFSETGNLSANTATMMYFSIQLCLCIISSIIVDKSGRRPLLIVSITGAAVCLLIEGIYFYIDKCTSVELSNFSFIQAFALIGFVIMFSLGMQTIPILMLCELFPTNVKAYALCLADIYFCIIASIVSKFFQYMKDNFGIYVPFFAFTICCTLGLVFIILCVPETKGKTLEDIQSELREQKKDYQNETQPNTSQSSQ